MNADGKGQTNLGQQGSKPDWSPDGTRLVYGLSWVDQGPGALQPSCGPALVDQDTCLVCCDAWFRFGRPSAGKSATSRLALAPAGHRGASHPMVRL